MPKSLEMTPPARRLSMDERASLKMVSTVIRPEKLDALKEALNRLNLVGGLTVTDVRGFGRQRGATEYYKGVPYTPRFLNKVRIDMAVSSHDLQNVIILIQQLAHTGNVGDGKIFVMDLIQVMRIRTGERGLDAL